MPARLASDDGTTANSHWPPEYTKTYNQSRLWAESVDAKHGHPGTDWKCLEGSLTAK